MYRIFALLVATCGMVEMLSLVEKLSLANIMPELHKCNRHQNLLHRCVKRSIESMQPYLVTGIPLVNADTFEPYQIYSSMFTLGGNYTNSTVMFWDIYFRGLTNYTIRKPRVYIDAYQIEFIAEFPNIQIFAQYTINRTSLLLKEYKMIGNFTHVKVKIMLDGEYYLHDITKEEYFRLNIVDVAILRVENTSDIRVSNPKFLNFSESVLSANSTHYDVWKAIKSELEILLPMKAGDIILNYANKIYDSFPTKMLFPY